MCRWEKAILRIRIVSYICALNTRGCFDVHNDIRYVPQAEIIPILPDADNADEGNCYQRYTSSHNTPFLFTYLTH